MNRRKHLLYSDMDMCSGPLFSKIVAFSLPVMLSNVLQLLYNAADGIVVGQFEGDIAFAAVGSNGALITLITCMIVGLSVGVNSVTACLYGAGDRDGVHRAVHTAMLLSLICGVLIGIFGYVFCIPLLRLMQSPENVLPLASLYMRITFIGLPSVAVLNFGSAILRAIGDTRHPMQYLILSGAINVGLNLVFVGLLRMGVAGVAVATIVSQTVAAFLTVRCLMRANGCFRLSLKDLKIHKSELFRFFRIGIPAGIQSSAFSLSNVFIQSSINSLGDVAVAGCTAAGNIDNLIYMAQNAFYHTVISFVAQNYGARKPKRILKSLLYCTGLSTVVGLVLGGACLVFGRPLLHIFVSDPQAIAYGYERLSLTCLLYFTCGLMEVGSGALRGINRSMISTVGSLIGSCLFRIVWIFTIFAAYRTVFSLFISYPISWILTTAAHYTVFFICFRKIRRTMEEAPEALPNETGEAAETAELLPEKVENS